MDTVFLDEIARANFLQSVMQNTFGCTYICMWSYHQQSNCLLFSDGCYHEENNQPSSSSRSLARRFFEDYCQSFILVAEYDSRVPGLAFKNAQQYIELNESNLHSLASTESQRLFYQEARIKSAVFMACKTGEIELGFLSGVTPINMETELRNLFLKDLSQLSPVNCHDLPLPVDPAVGRPNSSSSSSLRSLSMDSPSEYSNPILFSIPTTSHVPETLQDVPSLQPLIPTAKSSTQQQAMNAFAQLQNIQESEHAAMTRAILAVLTSPSSSSSSSSQQIGLPPKYSVSPKASAFKNYNLALATTISQLRTTSNSLRAQSMLKRAISYYRRLNMARREYVAASRPTNTQLHHMISERKRREKLNESFQALRSLLPPGTKKDKASLLICTREYLSSLKSQVDELSRRNQMLESKVLPAVKATTATEESSASSSSERVVVSITPVSESPDSEWRIIDLGVTVRGESPQQLDLVMAILEFLKQVQNVSLMSMETNNQIAESSSSSSNHVILRLRIQGNEWEGSAFQAAVKRVVADLGQ